MSKKSPNELLLDLMIDAEDEAKRFLKKIKAAIEVVGHSDIGYYRSTENAAAKRASMDLTKALAKYRKGPFGK